MTRLQRLVHRRVSDSDPRCIDRTIHRPSTDDKNAAHRCRADNLLDPLILVVVPAVSYQPFADASVLSTVSMLRALSQVETWSLATAAAADRLGTVPSKEAQWKWPTWLEATKFTRVSTR